MSQTEAPHLTDEHELEVNATGYKIVGYAWPSLTQEFYYVLSLIVSSLMLFVLTVIIARKCLHLKLAGCAEHAFYCTVSQVFCMGEALLLRNLTLHTLFGMLALGVGFMGIVIQCWLTRRSRLLCSSSSSKHGIFGLVGSLLLLGCFVSGMWMCSPQLGQRLTIYLQLGHRVCGLAGFVACMCSQIYGYNTDFVLSNWPTEHVALLKVVTLTATITASALAFKCLLEDIVMNVPQRVFEAINIDHQ